LAELGGTDGGASPEPLRAVPSLKFWLLKGRSGTLANARAGRRWPRYGFSFTSSEDDYRR
jgi:hypothetical protein